MWCSAANQDEGISNGMPFAAFQADIRPRPAPLTVRFTDDSTGTPPRSWNWDFGDGQTSADRDPVHAYVLPGSCTVTLTISDVVGTDAEEKPGYIAVTKALVPLPGITKPADRSGRRRPV